MPADNSICLKHKVTMSNFDFLKSADKEGWEWLRRAEIKAQNQGKASLELQKKFLNKVLTRLSAYLEVSQQSPQSFLPIQRLNQEKLLPTPVNGLVHALAFRTAQANHVEANHIASFSIRYSFKLAKWWAGILGLPQKALRYLKWSNDLIAEEWEHDTTTPLRFAAEISSGVNHSLNLLDWQGRIAEVSRNFYLSEFETQEIIDRQLRSAGWEADYRLLRFSAGIRPEPGRNVAIAEWNIQGKRADYALFKGLDWVGVVEAKKQEKDIVSDLKQSKRYSKRAEAENGAVLLGKWDGYKVPFLYASNGRPYNESVKTKSGVWHWDARNSRNLRRPLRGFHSPQNIQEILEKDQEKALSRLPETSLDYLKSDLGLNLRPYQIDCITEVESHISQDIAHPAQDDSRRALIAMATGTGKTRTVIGLCHRLIQNGVFKRILFLADRNLLASQAEDRFHDTPVLNGEALAGIFPAQKMDERLLDLSSRIQFATVQGMIARIFNNKDSQSIPSIGDYDCIVVDEAHRGYNLDKELSEEELLIKNEEDYRSKYKQVLDYFDAYRIGLTATPALHTEKVFGKPAFKYSYRQAVMDGFLVDMEPPISIQTILNENGITWEAGESPQVIDNKTGEVEDLDALEDELHLEVDSFNRVVITEPFNRVIASYLVRELDPEGPAKTLIFAANDSHADLIVQCLYEAYDDVGDPAREGSILKITGRTDQPKQATLDFKNEKFPNIAVTVDLLTTGIDVPRIANLVFLRRVRSRILFEQMLGRATRLCDDFDKPYFKVYDAVRMYEAIEDFSNMRPVVTNPNESFADLFRQMKATDDPGLESQLVEQFIAKLQQKKRAFREEYQSAFETSSGGFLSPDEFIQELHQWSPEQAAQFLKGRRRFFSFLDEMKRLPAHQLVSQHPDALLGASMGFTEEGMEPGDYLETFAQYIRDHQNQIQALTLLLTKPGKISAKELKELKLKLDEAGYNRTALNAAWRQAKKEDIAADIIAYIRTLVLNDALIQPKDRVRKAFAKVRGSFDLTAKQKQWLKNIEEEFVKKTNLDTPPILRPEFLEEERFRMEGGAKRINRIFENRFGEIVEAINENMYPSAS